jgi:hypothetical protein
MTPSVTQSDVCTALRAFILNVLPAGTECVLAQVNRVPEVHSDNYVLMTPLRRPRLATNIDSTSDCSFIGSIAATTLTVSQILIGTITLGTTLFGTGVDTGTSITRQLTGTTGGTGTYLIAPTQTVTSRKMACGVATLMQETEMTVQLDFHGPASPDNAQVVSTTFRDEYAVQFFATQNASVSPLYCDDPQQRPFVNDQNQYEFRWSADCHLQINPTITIGQTFFDAATVTTEEIDATFPA